MDSYPYEVQKLVDAKDTDGLIKYVDNKESEYPDEAIQALGDMKCIEAYEPLLNMFIKEWEYELYGFHDTLIVLIKSLANIGDLRFLEIMNLNFVKYISKGAYRSEGNKIAIVLLESMGKYQNPKSITPILQAVRDANIYIKRDFYEKAVEILVSFGDDAIDPIVSMLTEENISTKFRGGDGFVNIKSILIEILCRLNNRTVQDVIYKSLNDLEDDTLCLAINTLSIFDDKRIVELLLNRLSNYSGFSSYSFDWNIWITSVEALGNLKDERSFEHLLNILKESYQNKSSPYYHDYSYDEYFSNFTRHIEEKLVLINALKKFNNERIIVPIIYVMSQLIEFQFRFENIITTLQKQGRNVKSDSKIETFKEYIQEIKNCITTIKEILGKDDEKVINQIILALNESYSFVCILAIKFLSIQKINKSIPSITELLEHKNNEVCESASEALISFGDAVPIEPLLQLFIKKNKYSKDVLESLPPKYVGAELEKIELFNDAIKWYKEHGLLKEAASAERKSAEMSSAKVSQKVVQGDEITTVQDSVVSRSTIGGPSLMDELERLGTMKEKGLLTAEEFSVAKKKLLQG